MPWYTTADARRDAERQATKRKSAMSNQAEAMMQGQIEGAISENEALRQELDDARNGLAEWRKIAGAATAAHQRLQRRMDAITKIVATLADVTGQ